MDAVYRGRFAPTPSGPLHFGSLVAALGSYLDARAGNGQWCVRIEDIDPPRVVAGASATILRTLDAFGLTWDGEVMYQSRRREAYRAALDHLRGLSRVYACECSRKQLTALARRGIDGPVYPGICRARARRDERLAQRFVVPDGRLVFSDRRQGRIACDLARESGDFVVRRADGVYAYQLAVVVDDAEQGITEVVRGADLLASTPRQIALQDALGLPCPRYHHLPVVLDAQGDKLSKQTLARPLDASNPLPALCAAARFLAVDLPEDIATPDEFWPLAIAAWSRRGDLPIRARRPEKPCKS